MHIRVPKWLFYFMAVATTMEAIRGVIWIAKALK